MSRTLSTEEILNRMKVHVDANSQSPSAVPQVKAELSVASIETSYAGSNVAETSSRDFLPLRIEIDTALEGSKQFGQLNPRRPGLHNDAIQFVKRVMRRSLTWYTRPLHYFQGGVIRGLEQVLSILQSHEDSIRSVSSDLARQNGAITNLSEHLTTLSADMTREIAALKEFLDNEMAEQREQAAALAEADMIREIATLKKILDKEMAEQRKQAAALAEVDVEMRRELAALSQTMGQRVEFEERLAALATESREGDKRTFDQALASSSAQLAIISDTLGSLRAELREAKLDSRLRERDWRRFIHDIQTGKLPAASSVAKAAVLDKKSRTSKRTSDFDYFRFEELYRGDEAVIADRQREYLELFRNRDNVVDIGCGRGEFLELLRANGIKGQGVELGTDQFLLCQEKGLDVTQQDLFEFLESVPDESLGGLFSAQVIEHLAADEQLRFVALAYKKSSPDSPVVIETVNVQSVFALTRNFYLDPTHIRPVHPLFLKFAMESEKFRNVELHYMAPMMEPRIPSLPPGSSPQETAEFNRAIQGLNELLWGYLDYAAIGWR